ncbi:UNVERIFIED_CONTAM: hypothetical protein FKN15_020363 [Acipenser sinensis]
MAPSESSPYSDTSNSGKRYEELPNPADYVSYHHACLEPQPPPAYPPISLLPQNPYTRHPPNSPVYRYPPPGSRAPYICPKEHLLLGLPVLCCATLMMPPPSPPPPSSSALHPPPPHSTLLHHTPPSSTALHPPPPHSTLLHCTPPSSTALHSRSAKLNG